MKHTILIILLFLAFGQSFAQNEKKSDQIAKEIRFLEFENNKLILNEYIKEQCDTSSSIPIFNLGLKVVRDFQNSHEELKKLKTEFDNNTKAIDEIRCKDSEYMKYRETLFGSTSEDRKKQESMYRSIYIRLCKSNKNYKEINDINRKVLSKLNYLTLVQMTKEYHKRGEILSTRVIPYSDLYRYKELTAVKENQNKIDILNSLYKRVLEMEIRQEFDISDSIKTINYN